MIQHNLKHILALGSNEGTALVASLWLSMILALLGIAAVSLVKASTLETKAQMRLAKAWTKAESGVAIAAYHIADVRNPWRARPESYEATIENEKISIYVHSPQEKIDLNGAQPTLLARLFVELGYDQDFSLKLADRIADWRDEDNLIRLNGAESRAYLEAGLDYNPANEPFKNISELERVIDFDATIVACVSPFLTVYAPNGQVDPFLAKGVVRRAAGYGDLPPSNPLGIRRTSLAGQVFEVQSLVPISKNSMARITAIIRFTGNPSDPVWRHKISRDVVSLNKNQSEETQSLSCPQKENP